MQAVIRRRQAESNLNSSSDFLSMMLVSQREEPNGVFSNELIENQCLLQLWASHYEISGLVPSWMYQLGRYPRHFETLRAEQTQVIQPARHPASILGEGSMPV